MFHALSLAPDVLMNEHFLVNYKRNDQPRVVTVMALLSTLPLIGCASLDPTNDIARSAALASERTGVAADWSAAWDEPHPAWDGESPLTADIAVQVALHNNRPIRGQVEQISAMRADYVQAHLPPNPVINLAAGATLDSLGGSPLQVALIQQLAWLWQRDAAINERDSERLAVILTTGDAAIELASDVRTGHARIVHAQRAVAIREQDLASSERVEQALRDLYAAGEASQLDLNRASLDTQTAHAALTSAWSTCERAKRAFLEVLGLANHHTQWAATCSEASIDLPANEEVLVQRAVAQRLDIQAAAALESARAARIGLAERRRLPDVAFGIAYEENFNDRPAVIPSLRITPKIFDDGSAALARARSEYRQAEIETNRVMQRAITQTRDAFIALTTADKNARRFAEQMITLAQRNAVAAEQAFDAGTMDVAAMFNIRRQTYAVQLRLNELQLERRQALFALERAIGGTLSADSHVASGEDASSSTKGASS